MNYKICFLIGNYNNGGGTERVTSQIANGLTEKGYDISIISIEKGLTPLFITDKRIKLYELNQNEKFPVKNKVSIIEKIKFRIWSLKKISAIKKSFENTIKKIKPDIVIAVDIECYRFIDCFRKKYHYKTIAWEHFSLLTRNSLGVNYSRYLATKYASKLIVLSDSDLKDYQKKYPKAKNIIRLHNPVAFNPTKNVNMKNKVVIAAGRYEYEKGFDLLIEIWSKISAKIPDWELRIYGNGKDKQKLIDLINFYKLFNVKLLPYAKELDKEMEKASIYALSSRYEGWGLVLIEAQAKGLPCISFNCKHGPYEIISNQINGFLISPENTDEFANKLFELTQNINLRQKFSDNSQNNIELFQIDNVIKQWIRMLNSL